MQTDVNKRFYLDRKMMNKETYMDIFTDGQIDKKIDNADFFRPLYKRVNISTLRVGETKYYKKYRIILL